MMMMRRRRMMIKPGWNISPSSSLFFLRILIHHQSAPPPWPLESVEPRSRPKHVQWMHLHRCGEEALSCVRVSCQPTRLGRNIKAPVMVGAVFSSGGAWLCPLLQFETRQCFGSATALLWKTHVDTMSVFPSVPGRETLPHGVVAALINVTTLCKTRRLHSLQRGLFIWGFLQRKV